MLDERGRDKNQMCNGGRREETKMWDNYRKHFWSVSKTISIPEDLGHRCDWRTYCSRRGILDT
jgi:hypothetical protein